MENLRVALWTGFAVLLYVTYSQWSYVPPPQTNNTEPATNQQSLSQNSQPNDDVLGLSNTLPSIEGRAISRETPSPTVRTEVLKNNVFELYINPSRGADIVGAKLTKYHPSKQQQETPIELLSLESDAYHYFQTGVLSLGGENEANHTQAFTKLSGPTQRDGKTTVKYIWQQGDIEVVKTYSVADNSYAVSLQQEVTTVSYTHLTLPTNREV